MEMKKKYVSKEKKLFIQTQNDEWKKKKSSNTHKFTLAHEIIWSQVFGFSLANAY